MAASDTQFLFDEVAMASTVAPVMLKLLMIHLEENVYPSLKELSDEVCKPGFHDMFVLIDETVDVDKTKYTFNELNKEVQFISAVERNKQLAFVDVLVLSGDNSLNTSVAERRVRGFVN